MEVFRLVKAEYSGKILSSAAQARWNLKGQYVVYTAESRSLSTLELLVRGKSICTSLEYKVINLNFPDDKKLIKELNAVDLPTNWRDFSAYSKLQKIGSSWYQNQESLVLSVPSAIIPQERNYIINTRHPEFERCVKLARVEDYFWDCRLLL